MNSLIEDSIVQRAVSSIPLRSEREQDRNKLIQSYVDTGILVQLNSSNNQIFYGRRGTGKTHVLQVLAESINETATHLAIYIDLRTLGSNTQNDPDRHPAHNAILLFKDLLGEIHNELMQRAVSDVCNTTSKGYEAIDHLSDIASKVGQIRVSVSGTERSTLATTKDHLSKIEATISSRPSLTGSIGAADKKATETEQIINYNILEKHHIIFNEVRKIIEDAAKGQQLDSIYILLDEWTSVPTNCQSYLSEFIKRSFLTSALITVKIASLEYRSDFSMRTTKNNVIGFELGADITANLDLDDYWVFDRNPEAVTEVFRKLLYKHLITELPDNYLEKTYSLLHQGQLATGLFSTSNTFVELVRAAEGVARDFINIFNKAYFDSNRRNRSKIDMLAVTESARQWYEQDKQPQLDENQLHVLSRIISKVIGEKKARSFMIERVESSNSTIRSLFDYRVLHLIQRGYADKSNPGIRYNIYSLDYGTYVDLIKTKQAPEIDFSNDDDFNEDSDRIVPFDDKRSIRRIILTSEQLRDWTASL